MRAGTPIIDSWAQPVFNARQTMPEVVRLFEQSGTAAMLDRALSPDEVVALMDAAGIDRLMFCAWARPGRWVVSNDEVARFTRAYPDRFTGVAAVDLHKPMEAVRELERAVKELGFRALRVVPWLWELPPTDRRYYPLYAKCVELGIPFCTQVGHTGPLFPSETGRPIPYIDQVALDFPELVIVGGHIGFPWTEEMLALCWKHPNVYIDTSAYLPKMYPPALLQFMKGYGQDKVLFGTNFPHLPFDRCIKGVESLDLPAEAKAKFLGGNARRVFGL
ncbi:amidohydrolase family protein [Ferrovibrio sp.]|uniref:amidohydrolase family protein n=1 Tax=Ferrovibrio sp. TaxID=1917215 RepID=UPI0035B0FA02